MACVVQESNENEMAFRQTQVRTVADRHRGKGGRSFKDMGQEHQNSNNSSSNGNS